MAEEFYEKGILTTKMIKEMGCYPSEERLKKGPVAVCECLEKIPCNPCETACRFGAITIGENIADTPKLNEEKCTGCGMCIAACSGLAIFIMDKSYSDEVGSVAFPYEYLPLPEVGAIVDAVDRSGKTVCKGKVKKIAQTKLSDRTTVITLEVPLDFVDEVRGIKRL